MSYSVGYPDVLDQPLPNYWMIHKFAPDWLLLLFIVALLGTLIETGVGLVQSVIERLSPEDESSDSEAGKTNLRSGVIAVVMVSLAAVAGESCDGRSGDGS